MYDLNKQNFIVLTFAAVGAFRLDGDGKTVESQRDSIVEVAAVKIEKGKIREHLHSFVAIEGYDANDILEFSGLNIYGYHLTPQHLIGAPSLSEVVERLQSFIGDSIIVVDASPYNDPFNIFKDYAKSVGCLFNNPTICLADIITAARLQKAIDDGNVKFENCATLQIAQILSCNRTSLTDIFADYNIYFDPDAKDSYDRDRDDPLSWALAFARLFIKLVSWGNDTALKPVDEDIPF